MSTFEKINQHSFWIIIGALSLLLSLGFLGLGLFPDDPSILDGSWKLLLHQFFLTKKAIGQEIIFPHGVYGFLYSKSYFPGTYTLTASIWIIFSLVFWWSAFWLAYKKLSHCSKPIIALISFIWFVGLVFIAQGALPDAFFTSFSIFLLTYYFYVDERKASYSSILLTVTLSLISLIKFSFIGSSFIVISLITLNDLLLKQKPILVLSFLSAFSLFWLLAGQSLLGLPPFIINGLNVAQYYSELAYAGTFSEILLVQFTILLAILPIALNELKKKNLAGVSFLLGCLGLAQMAFKAGYTRIDEFHVFTTSKVIILIIFFYLIICFSKKPKSYINYLNILGLVVAAILFIANLNWYSKTTFFEHIKSGLSTLSSNITLSFSIATHKIDLNKIYLDKMEKIRQENPITPVTSTVDLYSYRQNIILAYGLDYQPRPVFQSNMTNTFSTAKANADYLKSKKAPEYIFFNNEVIDNRFPSIEDSLSWPELLILYDVKSFNINPPLLLLQSSKNPRTYTFKSEFSQEIKFNQNLDLSQINTKLAWVKIDIKPTLIGKLSSALWRTPIVYLKATLTNGQEYKYRLPRQMAKTGFLLSPLIKDYLDFAKLASQEWQTELKENSIKSFSVLLEDGATSDWYFQPNISVSFSSLDFPKQDLSTLLTEFKQKQLELSKNQETTSLINLSLTQIQQGDFFQAIVTCKKAIKIDTNNYLTYNNLGVAYSSLSLLNEAKVAFEQSLKLNPGFQLATNNLQDAVARQATPINQEQLVNNYVSLTLAFINNNMSEEAINCCEAVLKINPSHAITYNNLCVSYNNLRLWDKAIAAGEQSIKFAPDFQLAKNNLAWAKSQKAAQP